jgi:hypothetical protein
MCVIVAMKLPRDRKTGKPTSNAKWRLAKIRDRIYDAKYKIRRYTVKEHGASQLFLVDIDTDWTEGLSVLENGSYLSIVNSALNNHSDKKDGKSRQPNKLKNRYKQVAKNGLVIRKALKSKDIKNAADLLKNEKFDGCTLLTDGDRLFIIETSLPIEVTDEYRDKLQPGQRFEDIVPVEKFTSNILEIKKDFIIVRSNNGVLDDSFGYQPSDGIGHKSTIKRRDYAMNILEKEAYEPLDLIVSLSKMGRKEIDENPFYRPLRIKDDKIKDKAQVYTTSIIQLDPSGTMIVKPVRCKFDIKNNQNLISSKYKTHLVILPHRSKMFETFKSLIQICDLKDKLM